MKIIKVNSDNPSKQDIQQIVDFFQQGKTVVYPTDTIYGLGCIATDKKAIEKIYKIKQRDKKKSLLVLVGSWCMLKDYFFVSGKKEKFLRDIWPGPVSALLKKRNVLPDILSSKKEKVGVRLPKNEFLIKIIKKTKKPIVSTSLNMAGKRPLKTVLAVNRHFKALKPDVVVDTGQKLDKKPSKLLDIDDPEKIKILRK